MSKKKQAPKQPTEKPDAQPKKYNWMMEEMMKEDWWVKGLRKVDPTKDTYQLTIYSKIPAKQEEQKKADEWEPTAEDFERLAELFRNHR